LRITIGADRSSKNEGDSPGPLQKKEKKATSGTNDYAAKTISERNTRERERGWVRKSNGEVGAKPEGVTCLRSRVLRKVQR